MALTGLRSTHAVCTHVERLLNPEPRGHLTAHQLLLRQRYADLPVLGTVAAGFPSPADEELTDTMSLDEYLIANKEATYILKVNGNSLLEAANKDYQPIHPQEELQIAAVVRAVIRKY
jgi:repressor LexA